MIDESQPADTPSERARFFGRAKGKPLRKGRRSCWAHCCRGS